MGVQSAMYSGVSGLNANSQAMSVIGNNLANTNTLGFKSSRVVFADLLSSNVAGSGGNAQVGRGVGLSTVDNVLSQGTFETTSSDTDVAIEGSGFFVLKEPGNTTEYYSRAGAFKFDGDGYLTNAEGLVVQGKQFDATDNTMLQASDASNIQVANAGLVPANATTNLTFTTNLNEGSKVVDVGTKTVTATALPDPTLTLANLRINDIDINGSAFTSSGKIGEINTKTPLTGVTASLSIISYTAVTAWSTITAGDIKINGADIGQVAAGTDAATQAANVAAAINTADLGVTATVGTGTNGAALNALILSSISGDPITVALATTATSTNTGLKAGTSIVPTTPVSTFGTPANDLASGDIIINGTNIAAITGGTTAALQAAAVAAAINNTANLGVTATVGDGANGTVLNALLLTSASGAPITVAFGTSTATAANTGLTAGTFYNGRITLSAGLSGAGITLGDKTNAAASGTIASIGLAVGSQTLTTNISNLAIDPTDKSTYNYSASSQIFDSLGNSHTLSVYWRLVDDAANTWKMGYMVDNDPTTYQALTSGLTFDTNGTLPDTNADGKPEPVSQSITIDPSKGANAIKLSLTFDCTQFSSDSQVIGQKQNGYAAGSLTNVAINGDGIVVASYSNGKQINIAQLVLAKFQNPGGLQLAGSNRYIAPSAVGSVRVGIPGSELGKVFTNSLEQSNVDMGSEFVKMITTQRGFSANSKIITAVDEMLSELINLKR